MQNLYFKQAFQGKVQELSHDLLNWLITTTRPKTSNGVNSLRTDSLEMNAQRRQRYLTVTNKDGKVSTDLLRQVKNKN